MKDFINVVLFLSLMEARSKVRVCLFVLIVLVIGLYLFTDWFSRVTGYVVGESESYEVAKCLEEAGATFYSAEYCLDCKKQEDMFGKDFERISQTKCGNTGELCNNIREVPAWYIDGKLYDGVQSLESLKVVSNCVD